MLNNLYIRKETLYNALRIGKADYCIYYCCKIVVGYSEDKIARKVDDKNIKFYSFLEGVIYVVNVHISSKEIKEIYFLQTSLEFCPVLASMSDGKQF